MHTMSHTDMLSLSTDGLITREQWEYARKLDAGYTTEQIEEEQRLARISMTRRQLADMALMYRRNLVILTCGKTYWDGTPYYSTEYLADRLPAERAKYKQAKKSFLDYTEHRLTKKV